MKNDWDVVAHNVALFSLIGFLCWLFSHWWPVFLVVFIGTSSRKMSKTTSKTKDEQEASK